LKFCRLLEKQCETVRYHLTEAVTAYEEKPRDQWIMDFQAQVALTGSQIWWTVEVCSAFAKLEEGYENALKDFYRKQVTQLNALIVHLLGDLTPGDRQKIMTICTVCLFYIQKKKEKLISFSCRLMFMLVML
jgi:dynein heavy chain